MSTQDRKLFDLLDGFEMTKSEYERQLCPAG